MLQVGSYAFTTLRPQLGALLPTVPDGGVNAASDLQHMQQQPAAMSADAAAAGSQGSALAAAAVAAAGDDDRGLTGHRLVLADLPGLAPGAHAGKGRGIDFLKHLQKARCIAVVIDMTGQPHSSSSAEASGPSPGGQVGQGSSSVSQDQPGAGGWEAVVPYSPEQQLNILLVSEVEAMINVFMVSVRAAIREDLPGMPRHAGLHSMPRKPLQFVGRVLRGMAMLAASHGCGLVTSSLQHCC